MKLNLSAVLNEPEKVKSRHRIMLVDDEPGNLRTFSRFLEDDYPLTCFECPQEALAHLARGGEDSEYSVIISDHIMPQMTGVEFLTHLGERHHPGIRVILTGFAALDNVIAAINSAGVFRFATKPIDGDAIRQLVKEAIHIYELREENLSLIGLVKELMESSAEMSKQLTTLGHEDKVPSLSEAGRKATSPRRMSVAILFADVRGFTKLSGAQPPEVVMDILQKLFHAMHQVIYDAGGIVDKHLGDGLMAVFGLGGISGRAMAVDACKSLVDVIAATIEAFPAPFNELRVSFGLATGEVVVGMLGSESRSELAVIGQPANFAARLQEFSKLALSESGSVGNPLGEFKRVMALIDSKLATETPGMEILELPVSFRIRDFPTEQRVGVIRG